MHFLGLGWLLGKLFYSINFILYRLAAWTGTLYLYRQAREKGRKVYYLLPVAVYVASWAVLLLTVGRSHLFSQLGHIGHIARLIRRV